MPKTESNSAKNIFLYSILVQNALILNIEQSFYDADNLSDI